MLEYLIALLIGWNFSTPILILSGEEKAQVILLQQYNVYIQQGLSFPFIRQT